MNVNFNPVTLDFVIETDVKIGFQTKYISYFSFARKGYSLFVNKKFFKNGRKQGVCIFMDLIKNVKYISYVLTVIFICGFFHQLQSTSARKCTKYWETVVIKWPHHSIW